MLNVLSTPAQHSTAFSVLSSRQENFLAQETADAQLADNLKMAFYSLLQMKQ